MTDAHARNQHEADGFQDGWHAALKCISDGRSVSELSAVCPVAEPFRNQLRNMKAALHGSEARLYADATYEKYLDELSASLADLVGDAEPDSLDDAALRQATDAISHLRRTRDELRRDLDNIALAALDVGPSPADKIEPCCEHSVWMHDAAGRCEKEGCGCTIRVWPSPADRQEKKS